MSIACQKSHVEIRGKPGFLDLQFAIKLIDNDHFDWNNHCSGTISFSMYHVSLEFYDATTASLVTPTCWWAQVLETVARLPYFSYITARKLRRTAPRAEHTRDVAPTCCVTPVLSPTRTGSLPTESPRSVGTVQNWRTPGRLRSGFRLL